MLAAKVKSQYNNSPPRQLKDAKGKEISHQRKPNSKPTEKRKGYTVQGDSKDKDHPLTKSNYKSASEEEYHLAGVAKQDLSKTYNPTTWISDTGALTYITD